MAHNFADAKSSVQFSIGPRIQSLLLAGLAALVVWCFRVDFHRAPEILFLETAVYFAVPWVALVWTLRKVVDKSENRNEFFDNRQASWALQTAAIGFALLPILAQIIFRSWGVGEPFEIVALAGLVNGCWLLAVFSRFGNLGRASFVTGSAVVLFVCFMSQQTSVFVLAFFYAVVGLWWLLDDYWNRVSAKAIDGTSRSLPIRGVIVIASVGVLSLIAMIAAAVGPVQKAVAIRGFMPSSGGDSWHDAYARSGLGDGEMLTAGNNATTTGAVDSDQFIEDDKPAMYDVVSDKYEGPIKKKRRLNRAVGLDGKTKHMHNVVQSEQKGRSFRTLRQPKNPHELDLENRITDALLFVEGSVPARLTLDCFHHFDGVDWTKVDVTQETKNVHQPTIAMANFGKPWFSIQAPIRQFLSNYRAHRVKIMRLEDEVIPAPPLLKGWHIFKVDRPELFRWDAQGLVRMEGELIPPQTMIDVVSYVPNYYVLRNSENLTQGNQDVSIWDWIDRLWGRTPRPSAAERDFSPKANNPRSVFVQVPENETKACLAALATEWTQGVPEGWQQVEAITNHFRENFELDPTAVPPAECEDTVGWFLDSKKGPAYLFATAATQTLRAGGYRARLATGFVVTSEDYNRLAGQSAITADNLHMWPEICLDGWHWLPAEPTPGYPIPYSTQTILQRVAAGFWWIVLTITRNPLTSLLTGVFVFLIHRYRKTLLAILGWLGWKIGLVCLPGYRLKLTRQLLDLRFWAGNLPRPSFATPSTWYSQVGDEGPDQSPRPKPVSHDFVRLWQSKFYNSRFDSQASRDEIYRACRDAVQCLTVDRIKSVAIQKQSKVPR